MTTNILLDAMSPIVAGLIFLFPALIIQTVYNLIWLGGLKLIRLTDTKKIFWTSFIICSFFTLFVVINNSTDGAIVASLQPRQQKTFSSADIYALASTNYKIQPLTIILSWTVICAVTTLTLTLINKNRQEKSSRNNTK